MGMRVRVSELIRLLETLVSIPTYTVLGASMGKVAYLSNTEGAMNVWIVDPKDGSKRRLTQKPVNGAAPLAPGSRHVVAIRDATKGMEQHEIICADILRGEETTPWDISPSRVLSIAFDGRRVAFSRVSGGNIAIGVAELEGEWWTLAETKRLVFVTDVNEKYMVGYGHLEGDPRTYELFMVNLDTGSFYTYTPKKGSRNKLPKLNDSTVVFESDFEGENKLYLLNIENKELKELVFEHDDYKRMNPVEHESYGWTPSGDVWVVGKRDGRSQLFINGRSIRTPKGTIHGFPAFINGNIYIAFSSLSTPPRIIEIDEKRGDRVLVGAELPRELEGFVRRVEFVKYVSRDNVEVPMYVVESSRAPKPGPGIVYVHGGPWSEVRDAWSVMIASLVAAGYHVLAPNFRGSTGYGEKYRLLDIGDPGGGDLDDVVNARKWGIENNVVLEDKIAIMGYSYGGFMTYLAMGVHPKLWRCGVAGAGVVDWREMYGLSDSAFREFIDILFDRNRNLWDDRSPIKYVEIVERPICIIHPQNDTRTPLKPVMRYMMKLLEKGKSFEAHIVPDMGHIIVRIEDAVNILLPALLFLAKHM